MPPSDLPPARLGSVTRSAAQSRIITAALELFAEQGVSGTSLQMIADRIGVTKAAVYHQFHTKDEIVIATAEQELARLEAVLDVAEAAEAAGSRDQALEVLLDAVIDLAVERRHMVSVLQSDPVMVRFLAEHEPFQEVMARMYRVVIGADADVEARVPAAMLAAAIGGAVVHPLVIDLDDDTLRRELLRLTRRLFGLPD
ncbi:TetR/AcrR family transcriptional regulator [Aquihabitans sp. McL0605]|uniref:TetR/AcrR family transcriptional regulator n=1 Tax=Aquihabitans sp. McL0605 TaxID=3415671 RepID=UPI003CE7C844